MKQFWLQVIALLAVIFFGFWITTNPQGLSKVLNTTSNLTSPTNNTSLPQKKIVITSESGLVKANANVEIADNQEKRNLGLGGRNKLDPNSGMLFIFDKPTTSQFWMKGMKFPLDFIWIRGDTIVGTTENVPPPVGTPNEVLQIYTPPVDIDKVLEVNAGFVKIYHIGTGDRLKQVQ